MKEIEEYLKRYPGTPFGRKSSVRYRNDYRFKKAEEQLKLEPAGMKDIIKYTKTCLKLLGFKRTEHIEWNLLKNPTINYKDIKLKCGLKDERDIVWMKFTKNKHLGVVATSNDVGCDKPNTEDEYRERIGRWKWKFSTSGIIVHHLEQEWNDESVLIFPLKDIPDDLTRGDVERTIGNYLVEHSVPILDFYSHNY